MDGRPIKRVLVLLNKHAGTLRALGDPHAVAGRIGATFNDAGVQADVRVCPVHDLEEVAKRASKERSLDVILAGGGDGTLNTIANAVAGSDVAFGVIPLGTFNHFAKDLKLPTDLDAAVKALAHGTIRNIPVGQVNGRILLNFASLGLHPEMVRHRDAQQKSVGRSKKIAMLLASLRVFRRFPLLRVRMTTTDASGAVRVFTRVTPSVTIGNNAEQLHAFGFEGGYYDDRSKLTLFVARATGRAGTLWLALRASIGRVERARNFEAMHVEKLVIDNYRHHARVSVDGEVVDLRPPLEFTLRPGGLNVLTPS